MRMRVKVRWDGSSWTVDLPQFSMVPDSWLPVIPDVTSENGVLPHVDPADPRLAGLSCEVEVPDRIVDPDTGRPSAERIRQLYRNHPRLGRPDYVPDVEVRP